MPIEPGTGRVTGAYPYVDDQKKLSESYEDNPNYIRADYLTEAWQRAWQPGADPAKELAAGIGTDVAAIGAAIAGEQDYPKFTAKSGENYIKAALGDEKAKKENIEMSQSGEQKIEDSAHMDEVSEWFNMFKEGGKLFGLGALAEAWNQGAGFFSAPIANTEATISQALGADNTRNI